MVNYRVGSIFLPHKYKQFDLLEIASKEWKCEVNANLAWKSVAYTNFFISLFQHMLQLGFLNQIFAYLPREYVEKISLLKIV